MQDVHTVIVAIVAFIVLVGLMVVVHEFGHFALAKLFGVRVEAVGRQSGSDGAARLAERRRTLAM